VQPRPLPPFDQFYGRIAPSYVVRLHGVEYAWIYEVPPAVAQPLTARFGDTLELRGFDLTGGTAEPGGLTLRLHWHVIAPPSADIAIFAHLVGDDGTRVAQSDPRFPHAMWNGRYISTELRLAPSQLPRGAAQLAIGVYDPDTGTRLPLIADSLAPAGLFGPDALLVTTLPPPRPR
jgi:hypothetical protein